MNHRFTENTAADFRYWQQHDEKKVARIKLLVQDIKENHPSGIGKPEPLRHQKSGLWSQRIDREYRLVYSVENDMMTVYSCRYHYEK
ncbi:Txe/YoeB family addiction module toxin [Neisseria iguanae]|uniref:Putative mRNA interferase YoeB n=1 Tax=Neisseria iguanae TaxID=90242 RepID=A0A2P7U2R6_9NEIS|nr:Txe/YoeB family addiction module toxin [Neisseria iguanae]PSJ81268.1 Txe/YoeB family addiction module toxin [Neisseria iguanae]